jgi:hypothetical protein
MGGCDRGRLSSGCRLLGIPPGSDVCNDSSNAKNRHPRLPRPPGDRTIARRWSRAVWVRKSGSSPRGSEGSRTAARWRWRVRKTPDQGPPIRRNHPRAVTAAPLRPRDNARKAPQPRRALHHEFRRRFHSSSDRDLAARQAPYRGFGSQPSHHHSGDHRSQLSSDHSSSATTTSSSVSNRRPT